MAKVFRCSDFFASCPFEAHGDVGVTPKTGKVELASGEYSITGGGANVTLAPGVQLLQQTDATTADIKAGVKVSASVVDGSARSVLIQ